MYWLAKTFGDYIHDSLVEFNVWRGWSQVYSSQTFEVMRTGAEKDLLSGKTETAQYGWGELFRPVKIIRGSTPEDAAPAEQEAASTNPA